MNYFDNLFYQNISFGSLEGKNTENDHFWLHIILGSPQKTGVRGFRQCEFQTSLLSYRD